MFPEPQRVYENKRVVLITGSESKWFEQAIFIVKPNKIRPGRDIVAEAERIIESYLKSGGERDDNAREGAPGRAASPRKPHKKPGAFFNAAALVCAAAVLLMIVYRLIAV
jgi:hypothetical protein